MNRKFVKENKKVIREFLGNLLVKIVTGKLKRDLQKSIDNDPNIQRKKSEIKAIEQQMLMKIQNKIDKDAKFAAKMKKAGFPKAKA